jgi:hypothetical protein
MPGPEHAPGQEPRRRACRRFCARGRACAWRPGERFWPQLVLHVAGVFRLVY